MKVFYNGGFVGNVMATKGDGRLTQKEIVEIALGIEIDNPDDLQELYENGASYVYIDDNGCPSIDLDEFTTED